MWKVGISLLFATAFAITLYFSPQPFNAQSLATNPKNISQADKYANAYFAIVQNIEVDQQAENQISQQVFGDGAHKRFKIGAENSILLEN